MITIKLAMLVYAIPIYTNLYQLDPKVVGIHCFPCGDSGLQSLGTPMLFAFVSLAKHCGSQRGTWCAATRAEGAEGEVFVLRNGGFNQ